MNENTLLFKILMLFDFTLNVFTGGGFSTCFSTRAYFKEQTTELKRWYYIRNGIDKLAYWFFRQEDHCKKSYYWDAAAVSNG